MYVAMARHLENTELRYIADTPTLSLDQVKAIRVRSKLGTVSPAREVRGDCTGQLTACAPPFNAIVRLWQSSQKADHATRTCPNSMQMRISAVARVAFAGDGTRWPSLIRMIGDAS
jgi:hypothetical protein